MLEYFKNTTLRTLLTTIGHYGLEGCAHLTGVLLSCGPSQLYHACKGSWDFYQLKKIESQVRRLEALACSCQDMSRGKMTRHCATNLADLLGEHEAIAKAQGIGNTHLGLEDAIKRLTREELEDLQSLLSEEIGNLARVADDRKASLQIDALGMLPLVGANAAYLFAANQGREVPTLSGMASSAAFVEEILRYREPNLFYPLGTEDAHKEHIARIWGVSNTFDLSWAEWVALDAEIHYIPVQRVGGGLQQPTSYREEALFVPGKRCARNDPTVVVYHGNAMICHEMIDYAKFYRDMGFNVFIPTMGGYPHRPTSDGKLTAPAFRPTELSNYAEVDAELSYLKEHFKVSNVAVHGLSIGGVKAFRAAQEYGRDEGKNGVKVDFIVADQTFTNAEDVAENVAGNAIMRLLKPGARAAARAAERAGREMGGYKSDGLNNLKKAALLAKDDYHVPLFCIAADFDLMMGRDRRSDNTYARNFAHDLLDATYGDNEVLKRERLISIPMPHCGIFSWDDSAARRLSGLIKAEAVRRI